MKTKIYEIRIAGEKDWVCADTAIEALKFYCGLTDMDLVDFENEDDIVEVTKENWSKQTIVDTESPMDDNGDYPIIETFEEYMNHAHETEIIATTNY